LKYSSLASSAGNIKTCAGPINGAECVANVMPGGAGRLTLSVSQKMAPS
jgi:hypothetical protein